MGRLDNNSLRDKGVKAEPSRSPGRSPFAPASTWSASSDRLYGAHQAAKHSWRFVGWLGLCLVLAFHPGSARAVPAFAVQTGQPCQACHVGGFGPQLTPFGREFKLHGYTLRAVKWNVPLSGMVVSSFTNTGASQNPPPKNFAPNNNLAVDQVSLFVAGGLGDHLGAFIQTTYDGVAHAFHWDNLDVRGVTTANLGKHSAVLGVSLNNAPTVEDAWNTTPAWGFPYTSSTLVPAPSASPLLSGGLAQEVIGGTAYAWIDDAFYLEAGAYGSPTAKELTRLGVDPTSPGSISVLAPYARVAYQKGLGQGVLEIGAFGMSTRIYPGLDQSLGLTDLYDDVGLDSSWYVMRSNGDVFTLQGHLIHEDAYLNYTCASAALAGYLDCNRVTGLNDLRADASYYFRNQFGATLQLFRTFGSGNAYLYQIVDGNRVARPDTEGFTVQVDATPWGAGKSPFGPRFNARTGIQYTYYAEFNGARSNYDGLGSQPSNNNAFRVFLWIAY